MCVFLKKIGDFLGLRFVLLTLLTCMPRATGPETAKSAAAAAVQQILNKKEKKISKMYLKCRIIYVFKRES